LLAAALAGEVGHRGRCRSPLSRDGRVWEGREKKMECVVPLVVVDEALLVNRPPIQWNQLIPHIERIFLFVGPVGSVLFHNRILELPLGAERFHYIPPHSRTEHTLKLSRVGKVLAPPNHQG
jgi:hypothetical protein